MTLAAPASATLHVVANRWMRWNASSGFPAMSLDVTPEAAYRLRTASIDDNCLQQNRSRDRYLLLRCRAMFCDVFSIWRRHLADKMRLRYIGGEIYLHEKTAGNQKGKCPSTLVPILNQIINN